MRASAKAKRPAKYATGGLTAGQDLAQRIAAARSNRTAMGAQARPIARTTPRIRPQFAGNNLEAIKAQLQATGSRPGNGTGLGGRLFGISGADAYTPINPTTQPNTNPLDNRSFFGGTADDASVGNKKGGLIKAKKKAVKKKS